MDTLEIIEEMIAKDRAEEEARKLRYWQKEQAELKALKARVEAAARHRLTELLSIEDFEVEATPRGDVVIIRLPGCAEIRWGVRASRDSMCVDMNPITISDIGKARDKYLQNIKDKEEKERTEALWKRWQKEVNAPATEHNTAIIKEVKARCGSPRVGFRVWYSILPVGNSEDTRLETTDVDQILRSEPAQRYCRVRHMNGLEGTIWGVTRIDEQVTIEPPPGVSCIRGPNEEWLFWIWPTLAEQAQAIIKKMGGWRKVEPFEKWKAKEKAK